MVDTFCAIQGGLVAPYHLSTASTGHQLHVVFNRSPTARWSNDFNLTFTTREIDNEPIFDDETFVPQTAEDFNVHTAANFVRLKLFDWFTYDDEGHFFAPYGYRTDRKTASGCDILEFYIGVDLNDFDFDLTPDMVYACEPTHGETVAFAQLFVNINGREFPLENWPFIPFYTLFPRREEVAYVKYTYWNVKVGAENAVLNEMECATNGQVFRTQIIVKACPIGRFGRFCAERCQCYNGASCHSFNGACRCAPGWRGRNCNTVHPEVRISPSDDELDDLRYGQELQLTCTAYNIDVTDITWSFHAGDVSFDLLNVTNSKNSSVLHINSLLPEHEGHVVCEARTRDGAKYNGMVDIMISGCQDNYYGELCDRVCNCTELETCNRTLGCVCQGEGCPEPDSLLLAISLSAAGLILLLLGAIFLLHRHNNRLRVGNIDDPEAFKLGQNLKALAPITAGSSSGSIDMELLKEREIHRSRLQGGQILGEGAFGHVVKATLTQPEDEYVVVAVKKLKDDDDPQTRQALLRETCIMVLCGNHDNVIGLKGICFRDGPLQLVLEYAEHGSLLHLLWTLRAESKLNRTVLVNKRNIFENMMVEVCSGLEHLASRRLVHRDIAARNILICGKGTAKIADFGLARDMYAVGYHRQDGGNDLLPLKWMAPEGLKNEARFTHKSDVWSFGVLLWEVAQLGRTPYPGMEGADRLYDALQNHFRLPRPQLCTEGRYQLMLQCWKFNEKTRPDATTVRQQLEADPNGFFYFNAPVAAIEAPVTSV
ncbi:fibroblast growth factor receptor 4-like [Branchiostoma floridae x Branchiostoma japonicum]